MGKATSNSTTKVQRRNSSKNKNAKVEERDPSNLLQGRTSNFLLHLDSISETVAEVTQTLAANVEAKQTSFEQVAARAEAEIARMSQRGLERKTGRKAADSINVVPGEILKAAKNLLKAITSHRDFPPTFFVGMITQYDVFFSELCKLLFRMRPEKLRVVKQTITLGDLDEYQTVEEIRSDLIDAEIDLLMRKSHLDQILWLGETFGFPIAKDDALLRRFVEVTERRNL